MRIALVHYDVTHVANEAVGRTVLAHVGHMPHIQLLYVAAILEKSGVEVAYFDQVAMSLDEGALARSLASFDPDVIGLSVFTFQFHDASAWVSRLKRVVPRARVILGGAHVALFPEDTLRYIPAADFACAGEAEMVLPEFVKRWESGTGFEGLRGLVWRNGPEVRYAGPPDPCPNLDLIPFPARHLVPNERYYNLISSRRNYTILVSSRGCPFQCIFCESRGKSWRARSATNVVAEFEECHARYGVREVDIYDVSFTIDKRRVMDICRLLVGNGLSRKVIWNARSRVDTIDEEMIGAMREAGCRRIYYGIESGDPGILETLGKGTDLSRIERIVRATDRAGISVFGHFLVGSPGETRTTVRETVEFAKRLPIEFAAFHCLTAFPRTELYEKYYLPATGHDYWAEYISSAQPNPKFMGRPWTEMPDQEVRSLADSAMRAFYLRPGQAWRIARSVRSPRQLARYAFAGLDLLTNRLMRKTAC